MKRTPPPPCQHPTARWREVGALHYLSCFSCNHNIEQRFATEPLLSVETLFKTADGIYVRYDPKGWL
jgi:hypothetical protein